MATLDPQQQALLSAYLDGETTPAERAEVESLLEKDAEAKRLLAELRAVRESVRRVPSPSLGGDFTAELLRRIESRTLEEQTGPSEEEETEPKAFDWRRLRQRFLSPRSLAYAGTTVAVAILLMYLAPEENRETALRDDASAPAADATVDAPADHAYFSALPEEEIASEEGESGLTTDAETADRLPAKGAAPKRPAPAAAAHPAEPAPMGAPAAEVPAMKAPAKPRPSPDRSRGMERFAKDKENGLSEGVAGGVMGLEAKSEPRRNSRMNERTAAAAPVDVIRFNVTRKAVDEGAVRQLLYANSIQVQDAPELVGELRDEVAKRRGRREKKGVSRTSNEIVVLIEADPADLEAFLAEVSTQHEQFPPMASMSYGMGGGMKGGMGMGPGMGGAMGGRGVGPGMGPGVDGAMGRPVQQAPVPQSPVPKAAEPSAEERQLGAGVNKENDQKKMQDRRKLDENAPADTAVLMRNQAVILTDSDAPESIDVAQTQMQSQNLFRRSTPVEKEKLSKSVGQSLKAGAKPRAKAEAARAAGEAAPLRQAIVVFEIVEPPVASASTLPAETVTPPASGKAP